MFKTKLFVDCFSNLYFYYNEKTDVIGISHCCIDRLNNKLGEIPYEDFYKMSEIDFYKYLDDIVFTKPIKCYNNKDCESIWDSMNNEVYGIVVAISRECNLKCPMCHAKTGGHKDSHKRKQLYFDLIYKLKNYHFKELKLTDMGEPTIYLNEILEIMKDYKYCKNLNICSNCTVFTKDLVLKALSICDKLFLELDCDTLKQSTYKKIRVGGNFSNYIKNITSILKLKNSYPDKITTMIHFVEQEYNKNEILDIHKFAKRYNSEVYFDKIYFNPKDSIYDY